MNDNLSRRLATAAKRVAGLLDRSGPRRIVLAESCTAGRVAAALAEVPGISRFLCGSLVTYRESAKTAWLGLEPDLLARWTDVSTETTRAMAVSALEKTPEAEIASAVTGHLGPGAPPSQDGKIYVAILCRGERDDASRGQEFQLAADCRSERQTEAAAIVLEQVAEKLERES